MAGRKPRILITTGDPNGIGPEIVLKALTDRKVRKCCRPRAVGSFEVIKTAAARLGLACSKTDIVPSGGKPRRKLVPGTVQAEAGRLARRALAEAHRLLAAGKADALVTAPWSKEALHAAGHSRVDHTEVLADLTGCPDPITLFVTRNLRIAFLTRHLSLKKAIARVKRDKIKQTLRRLKKELVKTGIPAPRLAVAALNPHGGEGGLLGREELDEIIPAVEEARSERINVTGPIPADSVFRETTDGAFDCVLSLFHDQGHIAAKTLDFFGTVSVTLGLPFIRTAPDHGTAFDIAEKGCADPASLVMAVRTASELVRS